MYKKVDTNLDFASREKEVENFWAENNIAQKAIDQREGCKDFTFYDDCERTTARRTRFNPRYQRFIPALSLNEGRKSFA